MRKRPPLCPYCQYDLTGTYRPGLRYEMTCSECGETFWSHEVGTRKQPGEWTPLVGLRNLVLSVLWRIPITAAIALLEFWLLTSLLATYPGAPRGRQGFMILIAVAGVALGGVMFGRLSDAAGFDDYIIPIVAIVGLLAAMAITYGVVLLLFPPMAGLPFQILGIIAFTGAATIVGLSVYNS